MNTDLAAGFTLTDTLAVLAVLVCLVGAARAPSRSWLRQFYAGFSVVAGAWVAGAFLEAQWLRLATAVLGFLGLIVAVRAVQRGRSEA